ncbi:Cytochrome b-c1 complex subunit 7 [Hondaea fermentalgiana]|uniref:Cytochrome b-c1 complex subunit 7 n=1 Tax=Hondaea fermentalgiana TaxID=2315210 RepID=A0A2R5GG84_9STRA|nr:Cytochrome b-c1 complex subunit 7 [Hondaea fermentalgiana]|eukprot:GBG29916.1 Cytochrome b-c1 complex subunit 7 [Hondaea fermentalgiana]
MSAIIRTIARMYQNNVNGALRKHGLRYEDIIIAENADVQKAIQYLPSAEKVARQRRITRAIDLNFKHEELPKEIQAVQEPGKFYLAPLMEEFRKLRVERQLLK